MVFFATRFFWRSPVNQTHYLHKLSGMFFSKKVHLKVNAQKRNADVSINFMWVIFLRMKKLTIPHGEFFVHCLCDGNSSGVTHYITSHCAGLPITCDA